MKVGIVGTGFVGSTAAYAMVQRGVAREIVLVDRDAARAAAEADDLLHAVPFARPVIVRSGDESELAGCRIVILAAGANQKPGESRLQLLGRNADVFRLVVPRVLDHAPDAILLVATNPVDIMTHLAARFAAERGVPSSRVLGSGTTLDTARFRAVLARKLGVDSNHVHAYVLGEHGDSEVFAWSQVSVGGLPLESFCHSLSIELTPSDQAAIDEEVRGAAGRIIAGKRATYYGIGAALSRITEVILRDQRAILTVCTPLPDVAGVSDVTASLPHLLGGDGIRSTLLPPLEPSEQSALKASASVIRTAIDELDRASS